MAHVHFDFPGWAALALGGNASKRDVGKAPRDLLVCGCGAYADAVAEWVRREVPVLQSSRSLPPFDDFLLVKPIPEQAVPNLPDPRRLLDQPAASYRDSPRRAFG